MQISEEKLLQVIRRKRSNDESAALLGISVDEYVEAKNRVSSKFGSVAKLINSLVLGDEAETLNYIGELEGRISENYNLDDGTGKLSGIISDRPLSPEEIQARYRIDTTKWRLSNYWNKEQPNGKFLVSALITQLQPGQVDPETFQKNFTEFLTTYVPKASPVTYHQEHSEDKEYVALILPKQDAHFNKYDIMGQNNIHYRFEVIQKATIKLVKKTRATNYLEEVVYIVGSDQFNSEYMNTTTKGTPQQNILTYEGAFTQICNHEITVIDYLLENSERVTVEFLPGNHDQMVGWHCVMMLQAYYKDNKRVSFNTSILNRKYLRYGNTAIMLNHGDALKPGDLAHKFPMEYKEGWSKADHHICLVGDKHHEMSKDIHGIKFYQVPALSSARSYWDDKNGHTCTKAEMTGFVITQTNGVSDILKEIL